MRELVGTMASFREEKRVESVSRGTRSEEKRRRECHLKDHVLMGMRKKDGGFGGRGSDKPCEGGGV